MIHNISRFIAALALLATAQGAWAQTPSGNWADYKAASLTESDDHETIYISTAAELALYAYNVNNDVKNSKGYYCARTVELQADIDLSAHYWTPIGNRGGYYFNGKFNGNGHVITGMNITNDCASNYYGFVGCFKDASSGTTHIDNLIFRDCHVTGNVPSNQNGGVAIVVGNMSSIQSAVTNCLVVDCSVTETDIVNSHNSHGAIIGCTNGYSATNNYYYNVSGNYEAGMTRYNNQIYTTADVDGARIAYAATLPDGVTATATTGIAYDGKFYTTGGTTVTLSGGTAPDGYLFGGYSSDDVTITDGAFTMPANDATVAASFTPDPAHFSVNDAGTEYTIHTATGWGVFCDCLNDNDTYNRFSGKTVRLGADIEVSRMAGSQHHDFCGTFDGGGNTLTFNYGTSDSYASEQYIAPFHYVSNENSVAATIKNLHVSGDIYTSAKWAAGIVAQHWGTLNIENCHSNIVIHSSVSGDGTHGGFVAASNGTANISGCVFDGKLLSTGTTATTLCSGFVGYGTCTITDCLYAPADLADGETEVVDGNSATFCRNGATVTNCYYTRALGTAQGKAPRTVTAAADVTIEAVALTGTATEYTVSGITAYSGGGLQRGQTLYYGSGDQLSLTLSNTATAAPLGYQYAYTASAGTLSGTTLTMPDQDVTISVALAPIDWATVNLGTSEDPYMIYNKDQLLLLAHRVNGTNGETANTYQGMYFKLGADITFDPDALTLDDGQSNYEAIGGYYDGSTTRFFKGQFDGANHTVSGIRICKDGGYDTDSNQGLFGRIGIGAEIYDVHLTDARITGYQNVGGIVGYNDGGYISGCSVTDSYITATGDYYGTICGFTTDTYRLCNNYYHGCTVNGTAVTSDMGCKGADLADYKGALPAYAIALGANITTPPGTFADQTGWLTTPPVDARLAPENGFTLAGNHYFVSGYVFTPGSTLASGAAQGYTPRATLGGQLLNPYTPTGEADPLAGTAIAQFTVNAECDGKTLASTQAIYSTGQPVTVAYINADGTPGETSAIALDGTETSLAAGTYFAGLENVNFDHTVNLTGDVTLILKDGCTMNVGTSESRIDGYGIIGNSYTLDIYAQSLGSGALSIYNTGSNNDGIKVKALTVNGGNITADANGSDGRAINATTSNLTINGGNVTANSANSIAIRSAAKIYINGGTVNVTGSSHGISGSSLVEINGGTVNGTCTGSGYGIRASGSVAINGGNVTASSIYSDGTITLGWSKPTDRITASSYSGTVQVADDKKLHNGSSFLYGTLSDPAAALNGKTLRPAATATYTTADGTADTADAILLDASDNSLPAGNYLATGTLNYTHGITLNGNVTLILADNCHMNVGTSGEGRFDGYAIDGYDSNTNTMYDLTITSEANGSGNGNGALSVYTTGNGHDAIFAGDLTINGGNITADTEGDGAHALISGLDIVTINGGTVCANATGSDAHAIYASWKFNYSGGNVTATATDAEAIRADGGNYDYNFSWRTPADRITIGATGLYAPEGKTATFTRLFTDGSGHIYTGTLAASVLSGFPAETTLQPCLALADAASNTAAIADHAGQTLAVALTGRTLYKDGSWNTLCLPFSVTTATGTLSGDNVQAMTLDTSTSTFADGTLTLNFTAADETIPAGTPFIIKWDESGTDIENPVFDGVTVSNATNNATVEGVLTFTGTYAPKDIGKDGDNTLLYLGAANTLYYPTKAMTIGTHRAYFQLLGDLTAGEPAAGVRAFVLNFGNAGDPARIIPAVTAGEGARAPHAWYTLDGRRLDGQPTAKGLYIHGGKKVAIK